MMFSKKHNLPLMAAAFSAFAVILLLCNLLHAALAPVYTRLSAISDISFKPSYIAVDSNEWIYISETVNNRLSIYSPSGSIINRLEGLNGPSGVGVDSTGRIFVGNAHTANVEVYDPDFNLLMKLGSGDGEFGKPCGLAIDSTDNIYVADCGEDRIKIYNPDGSLNFSFGISGSSVGQLNGPSSVAVDELTGEIMVVDTRYASGMMGSYQAPRLQVFNMSGVYQRVFGIRGVAVGRLFRPAGIFIDSESRIYVTDSYQSVVQVFDNDFTSLGVIYDPSVSVKTTLGITMSDNNKLYYASINTGNVEVYGIDSYVHMGVSPMLLAYQDNEGSANTTSQNITITNSGSAAFNWSASPSAAWITLSQAAGTLNPAEISTVSAGVDVTGLTTGTYTGTIEVRANSGTLEIIDITLTVVPAPAAELSTAPSSLAFISTNGSVPSAQGLSINNTGGSVLNWTATSAEPWIQLDKSAGTAPDVINVSVDPSALVEGVYSGTVSVDGAGAVGSPASIPVALDVIWLTGSINVSTNHSEAAFTITGPSNYSGSGTSWSAADAVAGTYIITYADVPGYITPLPEGRTLQDGGTITFTGQYELETGTINVTTDHAGASFTITGPATYSGSGTNWSVSDAPVGTYSITYGSVPGYYAPSGDTLVLQRDDTIVFNGQYTMMNKSIIVGAGPGESNLGIVGLYSPEGTMQGDVFAANQNYYYGTDVAAGDINGDGLDEIITAPGPGVSSLAMIRIFDRNRNLMPDLSITAFNYTYGAKVASADFDNDGYYEVIAGTGPDNTNPAYVKIYVYDPATMGLVDSGIDLFPYSSNYGVNIASGDVNGDGVPELITSPGPGRRNSGVVKIWSIDASQGVGQWDANLLQEFTVQAEYRYSVTLASADVNGDGFDEIITGDGPHRSARDVIRIFDQNGVLLNVWEAGTSFNGYGAIVSSGDLDNDGIAEILVAPGPGANNTAHVKVFDINGLETADFIPFNMPYGANVAVGFLGLE